MKGVKCAACGFVGWADQETCKKCGASLTPPPEQSYPPPAQSFAGPRPPGPGYQPSYQQWSPPQNLKQGLAITSLVLGIANFMCMGFLGLGAISGLIFGIVALSKTKKRPAVYGGRGLAIAGVATNGAWFLLGFPIVLAVAIPNFYAARMAANEGAAQQSLRSIAEAEATHYRARQTFATLAELSAENLIKPELAIGTRHGYKFNIKVTSPVSNSEPTFEATAVPVDQWSGHRSFLIDETGVMRAADLGGREPSRTTRPLEESRSFRSDDD